MKKGIYHKSLFVFRRDLRVFDNTGLIQALEKSDEVIPLFIVDRRILERENTNSNIFQFMLEALKDLDNQLKQKNSKLNIVFDKPEKAIENLIVKNNIDANFH